MKRELVEKVAEQIRDTVNRAGDEYPTVAIARYALALAEKAASGAWRDGWFEGRISVPGLGCRTDKRQVEAAVERAVEGA